MPASVDSQDTAPAPRRVPLLALQATAVGLALASQFAVTVAGWFSLAGFAAAALLFLIAERQRPVPSEPAQSTADIGGTLFWFLFTAGAALCVAAGLSVYGGGERVFTHLLWFGGLLTLVASALAAWRRHGATRLDSRAAAALAVVAAMAAVLIFWNLTTMPPEVHGDDAEVGNDAVKLLDQEFNLFSTGWFEMPMFHAFPTAVGLKLAGVNLYGLRGTSAVLGFLSVLLLFAVVRRLWGLEVAFLASLLLASSRYFIHLSRAGYHYIDTPFVSILAVFLFLRLWYDFRLGAAVWCGILLGLGIQTYYATRLAPMLIVMTFFLWVLGTDWRSAAARAVRFAVLVVAALATTAPMIGFFSHHWDAFMARTRGTSVFSPESIRHLSYGYKTDDLTQILLIQFRQALTLFNLTGDTSVQYSYRAGGLLEPISAAFFILGLGVLLARPLVRRNQLAFLWLALPTVVGAALTIDTPFYPRISGIMPFVALTVAAGIHSFLTSVREAFPARLGRGAAITVGGLIVLFILSNNIWTYFVEYAPRYRHSPAVEISAFVREYGKDKASFMVGGAPGFFIKHGTIRFLTYGYDTRDIIDLEEYVQQNRLDPAHSIFVVMPRGQEQELIRRLQELVGPMDVRTYYDIHNQVQFYGGVPKAAQDAGSEPPPPEAKPPSGDPGGLLSLFGVVRGLGLAWVAWIEGNALVRYGGLLLLLAGALLVPWTLSRRRGAELGATPEDAAPALSLRGTTSSSQWWWRLLGVFFGPSERERTNAPPRLAVALFLLAIVALASYVRLTRLADLPAGLFCDEAGLGYNAYSLWGTGRDETGARFPLYVWSFGVSYKNPLYIYSSIPGIALGGLNDFTTRLPAALYGIATVIAIFFLGRALMGPWLGLLAAGLLAVLPWHLHFSRIAFELITYPFFVIVGFTLLMRFTQGRRTLPGAMFFFGLSLYTYVPAKLFVPLFLLGFTLLYLPELWRRRREALLAFVVLILTAAPVIVFDLTHQRQSSQYFRATSIFGADAPADELARRFAENYEAFFSWRFLFQAGDSISRHSVPNHGELYPFLAPLLLLGVILIVGRRQRSLFLVLWWLALYPIAAAMLTEIPTASRAFIGAPGFALLAAIGAAAILRLPAELLKPRPLVLAAQLLLIAAGVAWAWPEVTHYWTLYTENYPRSSAKSYTGFQFGHRDVVRYFVEHRDEYDMMFLTPYDNNQPQSFLLFYSAFPPETLQRGGYSALQRDTKMRVGSPEEIGLYNLGARKLWAVTPPELALFADYEVKERIIAPDGSAAFVIADVRQPKRFLNQWRIAGPYQTAATPLPPNLEAFAPGRGDYAGQPWRTYSMPAASVRLNDFFYRNADDVCVWAVGFAESDRERDVGVFAGFDDNGEVWVNGQRVAMRTQGNRHESLIDTEAGTAHLKAGKNLVAVKSCDVRDDWRFIFRIGNPDGSETDGLRWSIP